MTDSSAPFPLRFLLHFYRETAELDWMAIYLIGFTVVLRHDF